jgi:hypothetical protein
VTVFGRTLGRFLTPYALIKSFSYFLAGYAFFILLFKTSYSFYTKTEVETNDLK